MFISTRDCNQLTYRHIVLGSMHKTKEILNLKKLEFLYFDIIKKPSLKYYFFLIKLILLGKIFSKDRARINYENIEIGRFALAQTFKKFETYLSKIRFYFIFIKNLHYAGKLIYSAKQYEKIYKINAIYIDHCGYINGVLYSFYSLKKKIVFTNNYPSNLYGVNFRKNKNLIFRKYEESLKIKKNYKEKNINFIRTNKFAKKMFTKKKFIPWMASTNYKKLNNINLNSYDYIVYAHSFTDGQLWYGFDGFENTFEWLSYTLEKLDYYNKKVLVKAHPNFFRKNFGKQDLWDKKIFEIIKRKYQTNKNIYFLDKPIFNNDILKKIEKKTILISHHGTVLLEGSYYGFKTISSSSTFFNSNFKLSNTWRSKQEYNKLLSRSFNNLSSPKMTDILYIIHKIFLDERSYSGSKFWNNIIMRKFKVNPKTWHKRFEIKSNDKPNLIKEKIKNLKKFSKNLDDKLISEISDGIEIY